MSVIFAGSPVMVYVKESWLSVIHQRIYISVETGVLDLTVLKSKGELGSYIYQTSSRSM